jgi:hypothetical protein
VHRRPAAVHWSAPCGSDRRTEFISGGSFHPSRKARTPLKPSGILRLDLLSTHGAVPPDASQLRPPDATESLTGDAIVAPVLRDRRGLFELLMRRHNRRLFCAAPAGRARRPRGRGRGSSTESASRSRTERTTGTPPTGGLGGRRSPPKRDAGLGGRRSPPNETREYATPEEALSPPEEEGSREAVIGYNKSYRASNYFVVEGEAITLK